MSNLLTLIEEVVSNPSVARNIARKAKIDTRLAELSSAVEVDDGVSVPAQPTGGTVVPLNRSLAVSWDAPAVSDRVDFTWVSINPSGDPTPVWEEQVKGTNVLVPGLTAGTAYEVWIRHTNIWGRRPYADSLDWLQIGTTWTPTGNITTAVADEVDLAGATISGELGYDNIEDLTAALAALKIDDGALGGTKLTANTITAGQMAAGDAAFINAWIGTAAISSAKIASLTADKIAAGTINAGTITVASTLTIGTGGILNAGSASLTENGLKMSDASGIEGSFPGNAGDWITPPDALVVPSPYAGIGFFNDTSANDSRGIILRASGGEFTSKKGIVTISADNGDHATLTAGTAKVKLTSSDAGVAKVELQGDTSLSLAATYEGQWTFGVTGVATNPASPAFINVNAVNTGARIAHVQHRVSSQTAWRIAAVSDLFGVGSGVVHTRALTDGSQVEAWNYTGSTQTIRFTVFN